MLYFFPQSELVFCVRQKCVSQHVRREIMVQNPGQITTTKQNMKKCFFGDLFSADFLQNLWKQIKRKGKLDFNL